MPRRREKTRVDYLAEALELQIRAGKALAEIDLRKCQGELKVTIRRIRDSHRELSKDLALALRLDIPPAPVTRRKD